jgi:hypothetical protein
MKLTRFLLIPTAIGCSLAANITAAPEIVPAGSKVELVARTQTAQATPFTEGPVYREGYLYFTDTSNSRILRVRVDRQAALPLPLESFVNPAGVPMGWSSTQPAGCSRAKAVAAAVDAESRAPKATAL